MRFTSIQEDECDKGAHKSYFGTEINTLVNPNWFNHVNTAVVCSVLECLRLGTLISYNLAQVFEACDCLKLLSIYSALCVDTTGVVSHQLGLLGSNSHAVGCGGFVETLN